MFIELDKNNSNKIIASANFKFNDNAIETNKEIVRNYKGELVFKEDLDNNEEKEFKLNYSKQKKKQELKNKRDEYKAINNYNLSEHEELNILNCMCKYTQKDKDDYISFIESMAIKYDNYKEQINNCSDIEELENIDIVFEIILKSNKD